MPIKPSPAVRRAFAVLQYLASRAPDEPGLSDVARQTDLSKATCQSVLLALTEDGYVRRDPTTLGFSLGAGLIPLGTAASSTLALPEIARPAMEELSDTLGLTVAAAVATGDQLMVISATGPPQPFQMVLPIGQTVPFVPPLGAAFAAYAAPAEIDAWLARATHPLGDDERRHLLAALDLVRQQGYSVTLDDPIEPEVGLAVHRQTTHPGSREARRRKDQLFGEFQPTYLTDAIVADAIYRLTQIAAPVFNHAGGVALIVLVIAVGLELPGDQIVVYGERVHAAADRITLAIRGRAPTTVAPH